MRLCDERLWMHEMKKKNSSKISFWKANGDIRHIEHVTQNIAGETTSFEPTLLT